MILGVVYPLIYALLYQIALLVYTNSSTLLHLYNKRFKILLTVLGPQAHMSRCLRAVAIYATAYDYICVCSRKGLRVLPPE
jgi:hypothetical protein